MPPSKKVEARNKASIQLDVMECKRKIVHPFSSAMEKVFYKAKLQALESDKKTKWEHGTRQQTGLVLIQSTDIFDRARGFGYLFDEPNLSGTAVEWTNYTLKLNS